MNPPVGKKANVRHVEQVEGLHMVDMIFFFFFQEEILNRRLRGPVDVQRRERETREMPTTHS